jgi:hypothetical protein
MRLPSFGAVSDKTLTGWAMAMKRLGSFLALLCERIDEVQEDFHSHLMPIVSSETMPEGIDKKIRITEVIWDPDWRDTLDRITQVYPSAMICIRVPYKAGVEELILDLVESGCDIIDIEGSFKGRAMDDESRFIKEGIRSVHNIMVNEGMRDEITILASGGFAMAEHVAKSIICGADAVLVDFPALIALECRMCHRCEKGLSCPVEIGDAPPGWVASRTVNILGAWHNQLLEVMGAMGIRDIRRLRGEVGRAMFFEELDKEIFGPLGEVKEGCELE